jgi:hypothetical protein
LSPAPSAAGPLRNVENGLLCTIIRNRKNMHVAAIVATTYGISSRCRSRFM